MTRPASAKKIHITFTAPKKVLAPDAPRFDPATVVRPRPTASSLTTQTVVQQGYMTALEDEMEEVLEEMLEEVTGDN